jgi:hypothetical protein
MRITVSIVLNLLANGMSKEAILEDYPYPEQEELSSALIMLLIWRGRGCLRLSESEFTEF